MNAEEIQASQQKLISACEGLSKEEMQPLLNEHKRIQKEILDSFEVIAMTKVPIITLCDVQAGQMNPLDKVRFYRSISTTDNPEGVLLNYEVHPCLRILKGEFLRDTGTNRPDSFTWSNELYLKNKEKCQTFYAGTDTAEQLLNTHMLLNMLTNKQDKKELAWKISENKHPLEVFIEPEKHTKGCVVTDEIVALFGGKILPSYSREAPEFAPIESGDIVVQEWRETRYYYRVDKIQAQRTYQF